MVPSTAAPSVTPTYYPSLSPHSVSIISTVAGTGTASFSGDGGPSTSATISGPAGIAIDSNGNVYFSEFNNQRVRKITASTGVINTYAGTGTASYGGDGGVASSAYLNAPNGLHIDSSGSFIINNHIFSIIIQKPCLIGNLYVAEWGSHRIRKITAATSTISTIAGSGSQGYSGDNGLATSAKLYLPIGVAVDGGGNVYIGDSTNYRIRKVTVGIITTIAGTGVSKYSGDGGQATSASLLGPGGINLDFATNVYFSDGYYVVRKITVSTGIINTVAGMGTSSGYNGDNIQATAATLKYPHDVALDEYGNLYISDRFNNRARKVDVSTGVITTVAGTGTASSTGDGSAATSATVNDPCYIRLDSAGNYYISECNGNKVRKIVTVSTEIPTTIPTTMPTIIPTTTTPTMIPTMVPTMAPTIMPTRAPSIIPTNMPTTIPTTTPTFAPR